MEMIMADGREDVRHIIPDEEIVRVHGNANFGSLSKRKVVNEGVLKYAFGYEGGYTQLCILLEHGLIKKPKPMSYKSTLTEKGKRYLRAAFPYEKVIRLSHDGES
jgi:hypothetical protein